MKNITLLLLVLTISSSSVLAQTPEMFKYQSVLRDGNGNIMANENVTVDISILQSDLVTSVFSETHSDVTTTAQGLINLNIGSHEDMSVIDWAAETYFIEITVNGIVMGTSQLLSVPYSMHAKTVENDLVDDADADPENELQTLSEVLGENNNGGGIQIKNIAGPTDNNDATTKAYVDLLEERIIMLELLNDGISDIDGNKYEVVKIGNQIWMAENLKVTHYPNGDAIPLITDNTGWLNLADNNTDDAYSYYNNNSGNEADIYGALYTYAAAIGDNWERDNNAGQGVCPDGWHLPTNAEWTTLIDYLGGTYAAGGKMKETGTTYWNSPNNGATNESGFSGLPGGLRLGNLDGTFQWLGSDCYLFSATEHSGSYSYYYNLEYDNDDIIQLYHFKSTGFSVRCLRD